MTFFARRDDEGRIRIPSLRAGRRRHRRGSPKPPDGTIEELFDCSRPIPQSRMRAARLPPYHDSADLGGCGCGDGGGGCGSCEGSCGGSWGDSGAYDASAGLAGSFDVAQSLAFDAMMGGDPNATSGAGEWGGWGSWATPSGEVVDISGNFAGMNATNPSNEIGLASGGGDWGSSGGYSAGQGGTGQGAGYSAGGGGFTGGGYQGGGGYYGGGGGYQGGGTFGGWASPGEAQGFGTEAAGQGLAGETGGTVGGSGRGEAGFGAGGNIGLTGEDSSGATVGGAGRGGAGDAETAAEGTGGEAASLGGEARGGEDSGGEVGGEAASLGGEPSASETTHAAAGDRGASEDTPSGMDVAADAPSAAGHANSAFGPGTVEGGRTSEAPAAAYSAPTAADPFGFGFDAPAQQQTDTPSGMDIAGDQGTAALGGAWAAPDYSPAQTDTPSGMDIAGDQGAAALGWGISPGLAQALDTLSQTTQQSLPGVPGMDLAGDWQSSNAPGNSPFSFGWAPDPGAVAARAASDDFTGPGFTSFVGAPANPALGTYPGTSGGLTWNAATGRYDAPSQGVQSLISNYMLGGPNIQSFNPDVIAQQEIGRQAAEPAQQSIDEFLTEPAVPAQQSLNEFVTEPSESTLNDYVMEASGIPSEFTGPGFTSYEGGPGGGFYGPGQTQGGIFADVMDTGQIGYQTSPDTAFSPGANPQDAPGYYADAAAGAAQQSGAPSEAADAAANAAAAAAARGADPAEQANAAAVAAIEAGATAQQAQAIAGAVYDAAANQGNLAGPDVAGDRGGRQGVAQNQSPNILLETSGIPGVWDVVPTIPADRSAAGAFWGPDVVGDRSAPAEQPGAAFFGPDVMAGGRDQPQAEPGYDQTGEGKGGPAYTESHTPTTAPTTPTSLLDPAFTGTGQTSFTGTPQSVPTALPPAPPPTVEPPSTGASAKGVYDAPPWQGATTGDRYLSEVYDRTPQKIDSSGDFTGKDIAAAGRFGMEKNQYTIGGLDRDYKTVLEAMGKAMDRAGVPWSISSAYRDDTRQAAASGFKAATGRSQHGGTSRLGGTPGQPLTTYGKGLATDVTGIRPGAAKSDNPSVWNFIDRYGGRFGIDRPMKEKDPSHIQAGANFRALAEQIRQGFDPMTGRYQTANGKPDPNFARNQEQQDRAQREATQQPAPPPDVPRPPAEIPPEPPGPPPPPAEVPTALPPAPPPTVEPPAQRADIPTVPPARGTPDRAMLERTATQIAQDMAARGPRPTSQAEGQAALSSLAQALGAAGIPAAVAARTLMEIARAGARAAGYDPDGIAAPFISSMTGAAMKGYQATPFRGEVQGPPSPGQQRSEAPGLLDTLGRFASTFNPISTAQARMSRDDAAALALARSGTSTGGQPGHSVIGHNIFTFYAPGASGARGIEGPMIGSRGNALTTLDDVRSGASNTVSLAGHPSQLGKQVFIGNVTYQSPIDGKTYVLENVTGRVDDTGGKFMGPVDNPDLNKFDIAVGDFSRGGWNDARAHAFTQNNSARYVAGEMPAIEPRAEGGPVKKGKPYLVGEEGPEYFVPDEPGTVLPYMPRGSDRENFGKWPRVSVPGYPGRFAHIGLGGAIQSENRYAQFPSGLLDLMNSGNLRVNPANWEKMLADPTMQSMGRARIEDRRNDPYF